MIVKFQLETFSTVKFLPLIFIMVVLNCATKTSIVSVGDENFKGVGYTTITVSAPYEDLEVRSYVESLFKAALMNVNTHVFRAMDVMPPFKSYTIAEFQDAMTRNHVQGVLVVAIADFWQTSVSTPGKYLSKSESWNNLFGVQVTETETKYVPGFTLEQSNVKLDIRMFALDTVGNPNPIWRANSTTSGNYFTASSKVMMDAAYKTAENLKSNGIIKLQIDLSGVCPKEADERYFRAEISENVVILGGLNYSRVLGCLSCADNEQQSPFNMNGYFGRSAENTLWNPCGIFASEESEYSACNSDAKYPPILVNGSGKKIGELSINPNRKSNFSDWRKLRRWLQKEICVPCNEKK